MTRTTGIRVLAIMPPGAEREQLRECARAEDWEITFCAGVGQAAELLHNDRPFAAVVLDTDVDGMNWEAAVRDLAADAGVARIVLAFKGGAAGLWERVVESGGHDLLLKPLHATELRRAILHAHWYSSTMA